MNGTALAESLRSCQKIIIELYGKIGHPVTDKDLEGYIGSLTTLQDHLFKIVEDEV